MNDTKVGKELTEDIHEKVTEIHASCATQEDIIARQQHSIESQGREIVSKTNLQVVNCNTCRILISHNVSFQRAK